MYEEVVRNYSPNRHERRKRGALFRKKYGKELFDKIVNRQKEAKKAKRGKE